MDSHEIEQAAGLLAAAWRQRRPLDALPPGCRTRTIADAHAVQDALVRALGHAVVGFKIGATNPHAQAFFEVDQPFAGRLLEPFVLPSPARISRGAVHNHAIEAEFAFRLASDLPPRAGDYTLPEVVAATDALLPAIEIPDSRYVDWRTVGIAQLIADDAVAGLLALGAPAMGWRELDLARHEVAVRVDGAVVARGSGRNVLGDPRRALTWLANDRSRRGDGLKAGQIVITGTAADIVTVEPGNRVTADFGTLGSVEVTFEP